MNATCLKNHELFLAPGRLWSLSDMIRFRLQFFIAAMRNMTEQMLCLPLEGTITAEQASWIRLLAKNVWEICEPIGFAKCEIQATLLNTTSVNDHVIEVKTRIRDFLESVWSESGEHYFLHLTKTEKDYYEANQPLELNVSVAFPRANEQARLASKSYALGLPEASIYHSMMVLEDGLPALADRLSVTFDINRATWGSMINDIQNKIEYRRQKSATSSYLASDGAIDPTLLDAYRVTAMEFGYFNNAWRIHIAHGRGDKFDINDAIKIIIGHLEKYWLEAGRSAIEGAAVSV